MTLKTFAWVALGLAAGGMMLPGSAEAQACTTKIGAVLPTSVD